MTVEQKIPVGLTGENLRSFEQTTSAGVVQVEAISIVDSTDINAIATVKNAAPGSSEYGLLVRVVSAPAAGLPTNAAQEAGGNLAAILAALANLINGNQVTQVDNFPATQPVSGAVAVSNFPATQPVSAAALPLPTGASTSALQTAGNTSLSSIDGKTPALGQKTMAGSIPVAIASDQSAIPVTFSNFPLTPPGTMMPLGATDVIFAKSASTGVRYFWSYTTTAYGNTAPADLPLTTPASIGPGVGVQGSYRLNMQDDGSGGTPSTAAGTPVFLYLTSAANPITTFTIPQGGSAVWDGIRPWLYNSAGILQ